MAPVSAGKCKDLTDFDNGQFVIARRSEHHQREHMQSAAENV